MSQATSPRGNRNAAAGTTATRGVVLVVFALVVGILLIVKGGGGAAPSDPNAGIDVTTTTRPGSSTSVKGATTDTVTPPPQLKIIVANGSGERGLAAKTTKQLAFVGYSSATATDTTKGATVTTSVVYFAPGLESDAVAVAGIIGMPAARVAALPDPTTVPVNPIGDAKVVVILGPDAPNAAANAAAATTTTAAP